MVSLFMEWTMTTSTMSDPFDKDDESFVFVEIPNESFLIVDKDTENTYAFIAELIITRHNTLAEVPLDDAFVQSLPPSLTVG